MKTPLYSLQQQTGARFTEFHGWQLPADFGNVEAEYQRLRRSAGVFDLCHRGKLAVTGEDRAAYLHRMLSNEVENLKAGEGNYCFLLDPQGHVQADMNLLVEPNRILLDAEPFATARLRAQLERFIIMDQVEIADASAELGTIGLRGPLAREVSSAVLGGEPPPDMKPLDHFSPEAEILVVRDPVAECGFWLIAPVSRCADLWQRLVEQAGACGGGPVGFNALEIVRVETGIPRLGQDILETTIPQETEQFRALSFTKGCYPGQEIVERVRSRGHLNRKLIGVVAQAGERLHRGMKLRSAGKDAGELTSTVYSPGLGKDIGLGYVRREFTEAGTRLETDSGEVLASALPFS